MISLDFVFHSCLTFHVPSSSLPIVYVKSISITQKQRCFGGSEVDLGADQMTCYGGGGGGKVLAPSSQAKKKTDSK